MRRGFYLVSSESRGILRARRAPRRRGAYRHVARAAQSPVREAVRPERRAPTRSGFLERAPTGLWHPGGVSELWSRPVLLVVAALVLSWALVGLPRRVVPAQSLALFRSLVPTWRFFEEIDPVPALRYRVAPGGDDWSEWRDALVAPGRTPSSLLLNAAGNLHLACQSLIEHLVADLEEASEARGASELGGLEPDLVSYRLVCALIEQRIRDALPSGSAVPVGSAVRYQFRLDGTDAAERSPPLYLSRVHGPT